MPISTAVDASSLARVLGIKTEFKDLRNGGILFLPQRVAVVGQGASVSVYSTVKKQHTSALSVANDYGFGSPLHLAARQLFPVNGDGVGTIPVTFYPLDDATSGVVSTGDITPTIAPTEAGSYVVRINNIDSATFVVSVGDTVAAVVTAMTTAINAELNVPIIAVDGVTKVDFTSKWKGTSANGIVIEVIGPTSIGNTFAITQPVGGLVNPDVDVALNQVGNIWETVMLNCLEIADTASLIKYDTFGLGRWGALTHNPLIVFTGNSEPDRATAVVVPDSRKGDYTNSMLVAPGSKDLPFIIASRELARIVKIANNNPPQDYGSQLASGLVPGTDAQQWDYNDRDAAIKAGSSTIEVKDGVVSIADVVTFYHPSGDPLPAYRYVVDVIKLQNIIFNTNLIFATHRALVSGQVRREKLIIDAGGTVTDYIVDQLRDYGIIALNVKELHIQDNQ